MSREGSRGRAFEAREREEVVKKKSVAGLANIVKEVKEPRDCCNDLLRTPVGDRIHNQHEPTQLRDGKEKQDTP